jgi:hypothetical protein
MIYKYIRHLCTHTTFRVTWTCSWDFRSPLIVFRNTTYRFIIFYLLTVNCRAKLVGARSSDFQISVCTAVMFVTVWCCGACSCVISQFKVTWRFLIVDPLSRDLITRRFELWVYRSKVMCWAVTCQQVVTSNGTVTSTGTFPGGLYLILPLKFDA